MILAPTYYLDANRPYFPPALVLPTALDHIRPVADLLPPVSNIAIECRLQADADNVDFIPQFVQKGGSGQKLARYRPDDPIWSQVGRFCTHWLQPGTPLQEKIHAIWLEFDINAADTELPQPSIFVGFAGVGHPAHYQQLAEASIDLLQADLLSPPFRQNLAACFTNLPAPANLFSIGLMLARRYDRARVCIGRLPPTHLISYLQAIAWPGSLHEIEQFTTTLSPLVDEYGLALDVGNAISPKLGLECYLYESNPQKEPRWPQLLEYFVALGQCAPEKKDALLRWPGRHLHGLTPAEAAELRTAPHTLPPRLQNLLTRRLSHLKLVLEPGRSPETKAYLELNHAWFPFGQPND